MTFSSFDPKDPDDVDVFTWDFTDLLDDGEAISAIDFPSFPSGLTLDSSANSDPLISATISGGTDATSYDVTCRVTTDAGRQLDITMTIPVAVQ